MVGGAQKKRWKRLIHLTDFQNIIATINLIMKRLLFVFLITPFLAFTQNETYFESANQQNPMVQEDLR